jgi:hypothetical protein
MPAESAVLHIGRPTRFTLTHGRCELHSSAGLHRFEAVFTRYDFHARALIDTEIGPLLSFRDAFDALYRNLNGQAVLLTHEMDLRLEATVNKLGHVFWTGEVGFGYSGGTDSARYTFWIEDDQTSLPGILDQLNAIIEEAQAEKIV